MTEALILVLLSVLGVVVTVVGVVVTVVGVVPGILVALVQLTFRKVNSPTFTLSESESRVLQVVSLISEQPFSSTFLVSPSEDTNETIRLYNSIQPYHPSPSPCRVIYLQAVEQHAAAPLLTANFKEEVQS